MAYQESEASREALQDDEDDVDGVGYAFELRVPADTQGYGCADGRTALGSMDSLVSWCMRCQRFNTAGSLTTLADHWIERHRPLSLSSG